MVSRTVSYITAFIVACGFLFQEVPAQAIPPPPAITIPLPPLFGKDPEVQKCLTSFQTVPGCLQEVITSFLSLQLQLVGPACCKTFLEIKDKCLPKIFPFDPFFIRLLENHCSTVVFKAAQPPPAIAARKVIKN